MPNRGITSKINFAFSFIYMLFNWNIIGHQKQLRGLEKDILNNNIAHAYLFNGPEGIGKASITHKMAGILQCENNYCKNCPACVQIRKKSHLDTLFIADDEDSIKIETIRDLIKNLSLSKQSKYKIILIKNIERLTLDAANCLLKALEEPNANTIFLLTTSNIQNVLNTIISRCRLVKFNAFSEQQLKSELENRHENLDKNRIQLVSSFSMGLPARAISLLEDDALFSNYHEIYQNLQRILNDDFLYLKFAFIDKLLKDPSLIKIFLNILLHLLRKDLIDNFYASNSNYEKVSHLIEGIKMVEKTKHLLKSNVNVRLTLENLMLIF
ncbi:MAG: polymerase III, delta prime subunit protein [Candidatus Peregrinibacteria bacterium GW2011_GWA2_33_10]|nr:MAG: polymerase III, delta prime subunit protein [Candidatus Peregrinibacteria bacterium GW2011_GWA2_33_10]KKP41092.1 MAG: polymerase III subunit delta', DNA polymerase III subunit delta' protein [Candidatus Peregrinibacteria bacterium GW2011_GWC2_33_13]